MCMSMIAKEKIPNEQLELELVNQNVMETRAIGSATSDKDEKWYLCPVYPRRVESRMG